MELKAAADATLGLVPAGAVTLDIEDNEGTRAVNGDDDEHQADKADTGADGGLDDSADGVVRLVEVLLLLDVVAVYEAAVSAADRALEDLCSSTTVTTTAATTARIVSKARHKSTKREHLRGLLLSGKAWLEGCGCCCFCPSVPVESTRPNSTSELEELASIIAQCADEESAMRRSKTEANG